MTFDSHSQSSLGFHTLGAISFGVTPTFFPFNRQLFSSSVSSFWWKIFWRRCPSCLGDICAELLLIPTMSLSTSLSTCNNFSSGKWENNPVSVVLLLIWTWIGGMFISWWRCWSRGIWKRLLSLVMWWCWFWWCSFWGFMLWFDSCLNISSVPQMRKHNLFLYPKTTFRNDFGCYLFSKDLPLFFFWFSICY